MSTDYILVKQGATELSVLEFSELFDIIMRDEGLRDSFVISDLSLEELKAVRDKLSQTISYFE